MKPTDELRHEHDVILHMLSGAERLAQNMRTSQSVESGKVKDIIEFSRHFTDGCHHAKEEKLLFVRLEERGMPNEQGPIAVMLHEHTEGRQLIQAMETALQQYQAGNRDAIGAISHSILQYAQLLRDHIAKENNVLFPMSDQILTPDDQAALEQQFKEVEETEVGPGVHEKYHRLAHSIAD
jgi:hemerythrin-like domain-containing protein